MGILVLRLDKEPESRCPYLGKAFISSFGYWLLNCFTVLANLRNRSDTQRFLAHCVWWLWDIVSGIIQDHTPASSPSICKSAVPNMVLRLGYHSPCSYAPHEVRTPAHCFQSLFECMQFGLLACLMLGSGVFAYLNEAFTVLAAWGVFSKE